MSSYSSWVSVPSVSIWSYISCCCFSISASNSIWVLRSELMAGVGDSAASSGMPSWPLRSAMVRASSSFCARSSCTLALSSSTDIPSKSAISLLHRHTRERRLSGRGTKAPALRGLAVGPRSRSRPGRGPCCAGLHWAPHQAGPASDRAQRLPGMGAASAPLAPPQLCERDDRVEKSETRKGELDRVETTHMSC